MLGRSARVGRYLQRWWDGQQGEPESPDGWRKGRDAAALATEFRRDPQFELSQARFLYRRPDAGAVREALAGLEPPLPEDDQSVVLEAVMKAASTARKVRTTTAVGALVTVCALVLRNILRGR